MRITFLELLIDFFYSYDARFNLFPRRSALFHATRKYSKRDVSALQVFHLLKIAHFSQAR